MVLNLNISSYPGSNSCTQYFPPMCIKERVLPFRAQYSPLLSWHGCDISPSYLIAPVFPNFLHHYCQPRTRYAYLIFFFPHFFPFTLLFNSLTLLYFLHIQVLFPAMNPSWDGLCFKIYFKIIYTIVKSWF